MTKDAFWAMHRIAEAIPPRGRATKVAGPYGAMPSIIIESNYAGGNLSAGAVADNPHFVWIHPEDDSLVQPSISLTVSEAEGLAELLYEHIADWHRRVAAYRAAAEKLRKLDKLQKALDLARSHLHDPLRKSDN